MASYRKATVKNILADEKGIIRLVVETSGEEAKAIAYPDLTGPVAAGDEVIINTTAGELALGSGGWHFVVWNLKHGDLDLPADGHIMKLRYSPLQLNVLAAEEQTAGNMDKLRDFKDLFGMPVIVGTLHSQLGPAAAVFKKQAGMNKKLAYIMTDRAALPMALSEQVRHLKRKELIDITVTTGQAFGGDLEAVNVFSGLAAAKAIGGAEAAIVTMGVGVAGTETFLGFSGIEQGEIVNAVAAMRGRPIAIPRLNFADKRARHQGLSDQTVAALGLAALVTCDVPIPRMDTSKHEAVMMKMNMSGLAAKHRIAIIAGDNTEEALDMFDLKPSTMKRGFKEEPEFFRAAGAAGYVAAKMIKRAKS
ncbi:MAG: DUF3866 family protein [Actinomycetota bacterium]